MTEISIYDFVKHTRAQNVSQYHYFVLRLMLSFTLLITQLLRMKNTLLLLHERMIHDLQ